MIRSLIREKRRGSGLLRSISGGRFALGHNVSFHEVNHFPKGISTLENVCSSRWSLLGKLERELKEHKIDEAWETYNNFVRGYGFVDQSLMANLITESSSSYSSDSKSLRMASHLVVKLSKERSVLLKPELMTKLLLSLARAQIIVPAARVVRLMLEKKILPSLEILQMVFLHLVKTEIGAYLASNILEEICCSLKEVRVNRTMTRPDVMVFNLVLAGCVRYGASLKGQLIMELMPVVGVAADAHTAVIVARMHEMNAARDELRKFKDCVDMVPVNLVHYYVPFYDSLLSLHFKFNDIDSASTLLLDLSEFYLRGRNEQRSCTVSIGSDNIKMGLKLQFLPQQLQKDFVYKLNQRQELLLHKNGKFVLTDKGLAKLITGYKRAGRINELSRLLITIQEMVTSPYKSSPCSLVIEACLYLGWLETAHDILDDLVVQNENHSVCLSSYTLLLSAYHSRNMVREAEGLVRQIQRLGFDIETSSKISDSEDKRTSNLANSISQTMGGEEEEDGEVSLMLHQFNSSIFFFAKAKMIEDARETYRKMQKLKIHPNASTYFYLICGYSSLGMYREITILWGDIKRSMVNRNAVYKREVYELVLLNFIQGGYFERVMEVIHLMMENGMFLDKWCYKTEFLKFHRNLYRTLTLAEAKDEAQRMRLEHVKAFRRWAGIS